MTVALVDLFSALTLACSGLVVGILVSELVLILPLVRTLAPADGLSVLRFAGFRAWRLAPYLAGVAGLSGVTVLVIWPWRGAPAEALLTAAGVAFWTSAGAVTFTLYLPIDQSIRRISPDGAAAKLPSLLPRATRLHALRTTFFTTGFLCFVLSVVLK